MTILVDLQRLTIKCLDAGAMPRQEIQAWMQQRGVKHMRSLSVRQQLELFDVINARLRAKVPPQPTGVEFGQLNHTSTYRFHCVTNDKTLPDCTVKFVATYPWDGAYLVVENVDADDGPVFFGCVREELTEVFA